MNKELSRVKYNFVYYHQKADSTVLKTLRNLG